MQKVEIKRFDGGTDIVNVYNCKDFPYEYLDTSTIKCKNKKKKPVEICKTFATYDIETTTINGDRPFGFMYHWQMTVGGVVCVGRSWSEWIEFVNKVAEIMRTDDYRHLIIYVHNLAYEFQFMRDFIDKHFGGIERVFSAQKRKPIQVVCGNGVQFRCSYKLTNMSLEKACENELGVVHCKAKGDLDYRVRRTAITELTRLEMGYNISDVVCLHELIQQRLINEKDTLETIPMTSTGYVRRDCRNATQKDPSYREMFKSLAMDANVYKLLCQAGRGGDTHANRCMSGRVWHDVDSYDVASSYPAQMFLKKYPMSKFTPYGDLESMQEFEALLEEYACLFTILLSGVSVKEHIAMPYIPIAKCFNTSQTALDNGRVLSADFIAITVTDIDYQIIKRQYDWEEIGIVDLHFATYGYLPDSLLSQVSEYFRQKTELKDKIKYCEERGEEDKVAEYEYLYAKSKNRLNGIFGMCYTNPVHETILINEAGEWVVQEPDVAEELERYFNGRNNFLIYAWGVWITAHARMHLAQLVEATGQDTTIYCDTDSSKAVGVDQSKIDALNAEIMKIADERGAYCDCNGTRYYMGIYEHENKEPIKEFKTLGAKKYCYVDHKGLHVTISGVNKKLGSKELGTIDNFKTGFIFKEAGGVTLYYNDDLKISEIDIDGCIMENGSNVGIVDSTYELGLTDEYAELIGYDSYENI